jgi:hypothetical protein
MSLLEHGSRIPRAWPGVLGRSPMAGSGVVPGCPIAPESWRARCCGELLAENARLRDAVERQRMLLEDKDAKIAALEERVARLERLISRNSGDSSMPPSTDDVPGKKPLERRPQRGTGRKPGKQRGLRA